MLEEIQIYSKAIKNKSVGTASGGLCIMYRPDLVHKIEIISKTESWICIKVKIEQKELIVCNVYINSGKKQILRTLEEVVKEIKEKTATPIIVGGDFNARIGTGNQVEEQITEKSELTHLRKSKDKDISKAGRILCEIMEDAGLIVLNGRTKSDNDGQYTYVDTKGLSTIDMAWIDINMIQEIEDFEAIEMGASDHLPIKIKLKNMGKATNEEEEEESGPKTINKLIWDNNKCEDYQKAVEEQLTEIEATVENPHLRIITAIKNAANTLEMSTVRRINRTKNTINNPWYNLDCRKARKEMKEIAKAFRKMEEPRKEKNILKREKITGQW